MALKKYQEEAITELLKKFTTLQLQGNGSCGLKAPTGSGKTRIAADFLPKFTTNNDEPFAFIWFAVHTLHTQSLVKLQEYYDEIGDTSLTLSIQSDLQNDEIKQNEILFLNWESVTKSNNTIHLINEDQLNFKQIIENTKLKRRLFVIVDESHFYAKGEKAKELLDAIEPDLTLNISATPHVVCDDTVTIQEISVENEEMITKSTGDSGRIIINDGVDANQKITAKSSTEQVIDEAIAKQKELKKFYEAEGSNVNPLVLIQLPSDDNTQLTNKTDEIKAILSSKQPSIAIDTSPPSLAIWLSNDYKNLDDIDTNDNDVTFLIFKQAIAIGWDCPRAQILVTFRDMNDPSFTTQTLGRIIRMPEQKHYKEMQLNKAYVFTNIGGVRTKIEDAVAKSWTVENISKRSNNYTNLELNSEYVLNDTPKKQLTKDFAEILKTKMKDVEIVINDPIDNIEIQRLTESSINFINRKEFSKTGQGYASAVLGKYETSYVYRSIIKDLTSGYVSSEQLLDETLEEIIEEKSGKSDRFDIERIVYHNKDTIKQTINESRQEFDQAQTNTSNQSIVTNHTWEVYETQYSNEHYSEIVVTKSIMKPFFKINNASGVENDFTGYLENNADVKWWHKGRTAQGDDFSLVYERNGKKHDFFPDWIVYYNDDSVGIYDTKGGTASDAKQPEKSDALRKYINEQNSLGKNLKGGLVIVHNKTWKVFTKDDYSEDENDWDLL